MEREELLAKIKNLSSEEQDTVYRYLWAERVKIDVEDYAADNGITLGEGDVDAITHRYVYDGEYDCNLDYWTNIGKLVEQCQRDKNL